MYREHDFPDPQGQHAGPFESKLRGRHSECEALDRLLESIRAGVSAVLVVRGERGIGKSALLTYLVDRAAGVRCARAAGVESEMALPYSGLHQLCAPVLDLRDGLPAPQRDALASAFGLSAKPVASPLVVDLAVLGLMTAVASAAPLVCVIDDAQWLDSASLLTLAFVARRLPAAPIAFVFAVREPCEMNELSGLPQLVVGGLRDHDAGTLLDAILPGRLDPQVRDRIVAESSGNPLTLFDVARSARPAEFAGGFAVPDVSGSANALEERVARARELLPADARRVLLLAAAEPVGDSGLLWRATGRLGVDRDAVAFVQQAGLIDVGAVVRFSHPLLRSVIYRKAALADRQEAHRALADATDSVVDADRRAWHQGHATHAPDEDVAGELERLAGRAEARAGVAAGAAFLARATELTPDPVRRRQRALDAAERKARIGDFEGAVSILASAGEGSANELERARLNLTRGRIAFAQGRAGEACALLLTSARTLEALDGKGAPEAYLEALSAAMLNGHLPNGPGLITVAEAARQVAPQSNPDALLEALALRLTDGYSAAAHLARTAIAATRDDDHVGRAGLRRLWLASALAADLWDDRRWDALSARHVQLARAAGVISELPLALDSRVFVHLFAGELAEAARLVEEAQEVSTAAGSELVSYGALGVAAWRGCQAESRKPVEAHWTNALRFNALGLYDGAVAAATDAANSDRGLGTPNWCLVELIEAAARSGRNKLAAASLDRLSGMVRASATDWSLGVEARSRALLSERETAERLYRQATERLARTRMRSELARAQLLYGEWLRREGRRVDARVELRAAHELFEAIGMEAFAERARRELLATGEKVRRRSIETRDELTAQERQIAQLARDGLSNSAIGGQLYLSPRTVEWHLRKVFSKLGVRSRRELPSALPDPEGPISSIYAGFSRDQMRSDCIG